MTIDTSTTAGKIAVMQHCANGGKIEVRHLNGARWVEIENCAASWDWANFDYRIKREPRVWVVFEDDGIISSAAKLGSAAKAIKVREVLDQ